MSVVLICEDDEVIAMYLRILLEKDPGITRVIVITDHFEELFERDDWDTVDVVIADYYLHPMNGGDILNWLAGQHPRIARILSSGDESTGSRVESAEVFLPKPVTPVILIETIHRLTEQKKSAPQDADEQGETPRMAIPTKAATEKFARDLAERVIVTWFQAFGAMLVASGAFSVDGVVDLAIWQKAAIAGIAAVLSLIKGLVARAVGNPNNASLVDSTVV